MRDKRQRKSACEITFIAKSEVIHVPSGGAIPSLSLGAGEAIPR
jgi:hypothetical protein